MIQEVNIKLGDNLSKFLYLASKETQKNRPDLLSDIGGTFSGFRGIPLDQFPDATNLTMNIGFDGIGTKVEIAERVGDHSTMAFDLFAMVCDDAVVRGGEPIGIGSILDVRQLNEDEDTSRAVQQLAAGYIAAAKTANVVVLNGELAELGARIGGYGPFNYNWCATVLWLAHKDRILTGDKIRAGDTIVGLAEKGFRSNGLTDVRKSMLAAYGENWHQEYYGQHTLGELVLTPSTIYTPFICALTGGYDINRKPLAKISGVAHITGGGQPSKIGRMLRQTNRLGAHIYDPIEPPPIMKLVQTLCDFDDDTAYRKWHMGPGMIVTTPEPDRVLKVAPKFGITAQAIGEITDTGAITIKSCGTKTPGRFLMFGIEQ